MANTDQDIPMQEMRRLLVQARQLIEDLGQRAEKAENEVARFKELYDSAIAVNRRLISERENAIARVNAALHGIHMDKK